MLSNQQLEEVFLYWETTDQATQSWVDSQTAQLLSKKRYGVFFKDLPEGLKIWYAERLRNEAV
jgi:hypothetical protein